jgi:hypothetical protein
MASSLKKCSYCDDSVTHEYLPTHLIINHADIMTEQFKHHTDSSPPPYINKDKTFTFCFHCRCHHILTVAKTPTRNAISHLHKCSQELQRAALKRFISSVPDPVAQPSTEIPPIPPIPPIAPQQHIHIHRFEISDELIELIKLLKSSP